MFSVVLNFNSYVLSKVYLLRDLLSILEEKIYHTEIIRTIFPNIPRLTEKRNF